jgi:putative peptidoglycan lipid II flippase
MTADQVRARALRTLAASLRPLRWPMWLRVVGLAVLAKGFAFLREPVIAAAFGANSSADAYYLAIGLPFLFSNLLGVPFSLWVTARLASADRETPGAAPRTFYRRALWWGFATSTLVAFGLALLSRAVVRAYAPGLGGDRLEEAVALARLGAAALPALVLQAVCGGRLFAEHRFATVYAWLTLGGLVGLIGVLVLTPIYGPGGAVVAFSATWWTAGLGLLAVPQRRVVAPSLDPGASWGEDLGVGVAYRALAMQLFFQGNGLLVFSFASYLAAGEIAATLFAGKIIMALYETIVVTAGVLVFPRIARLLQNGDERAVGRAIMEALNWLVPVTVAFMMLLALWRTDLVTLVYRRRAFDARATALVSQALLGYAPYIVGTTLVEILHRAMVLRGRIGGYLTVFGGALLVNWLACRLLVPALGVTGVALGSSIGVLAAGAGLWTYVHRRLPTLRPRPIALLIGRTLAAAAAVLVVITWMRSRMPVPMSAPGRLLLLLGGMLAAGSAFAGVLALLGYRWRRLANSDGREATT